MKHDGRNALGVVHSKGFYGLEVVHQVGTVATVLLDHVVIDAPFQRNCFFPPSLLYTAPRGVREAKEKIVLVLPGRICDTMSGRLRKHGSPLVV